MSQKNKIYIAKRPDFLLEPSTEEDEIKLQKFAVGEIIQFTYTAIRSYLNLKRYFVMVKIGFDNQDQISDPEIYRKMIEMQAGHFDEVQLVYKGENYKRRWPKSISYETLDEEEFTDLKKRVGDVICQRLGITEDILQEEVLKLAYINKQEFGV